MGRMPGLALFGVKEKESDLEEIVLWPEDKEGSGVRVETKRGGPAHPRTHLSPRSPLSPRYGPQWMRGRRLG